MSKKLTHDEILNRLEKLYSGRYEYEIGNIKGVQDKIKIICKNHGESYVRLWDLFDYSQVKYVNNRTKVALICRNHNIKFDQAPLQHLNGNTSCPKCLKVISLGEKSIRDILTNNDVEYIEQYSFKDCRNKNILKFDFYLPTYNTIVEYDGRQHFIQGWNSFKEFERIKENDLIKNKYCLDNNIKLIRISYIDFKNIESILKKELTI